MWEKIPLNFISEILKYASEFGNIDEESVTVARKLASVAATSAALSVKQQHQHQQNQRNGSNEDVGVGIATNLIRFAESMQFCFTEQRRRCHQ